MDKTINLIKALKEDAEQLRRVLAMKPKVGDTYPGESQVQQIKSLIDDLEKQITTPAP
jgi:hypothetical protein